MGVSKRLINFRLYGWMIVLVTLVAGWAVGQTDTPPLRISLNERVTTMDPNIHNLRGPFQVHYQVYEPLVRLNDEGNYEGILATDWEVIDDTTWEFNLRQGVSFHDGTPFDAAAAKAALDRLLDPDFQAQSAQGYLFEDFESVEVVDEDTIRINTSTAVGTMLPTLQLAGTIPSPETLDGSEEISEANGIAGTGPFHFVSWRPGEEIVLEANPDYWGDAPEIDRVVFIYQPDAATRFASLRAGDVDLVGDLSHEHYLEMQNYPINSVRVVSSQIMWTAFGHLTGAMTDPLVREAAVLAIDREGICATVLEGRGTCLNGYIPSSVFGSAEFEPYDYDPERARELLAEAGYANGGPTVRFLTIPNTPMDVAEVVIAQLEQVGFDVEFRVLEVAAYLEARAEGNYEMFMNGWAIMNGHASSILPGMIGPEGRGHYGNQEVHDLLAQAGRELDVERQAELYREAQQIAWDDFSQAWVFVQTHVYGLREGWEGFEPDPSSAYLNLNTVRWTGN